MAKKSNKGKGAKRIPGRNADIGAFAALGLVIYGDLSISGNGEGVVGGTAARFGDVVISGEGTLSCASLEFLGSVTISGGGTIVLGSYLVGAMAEEVWFDSRGLIGAVGISLLERVD